MNPLTSLLVMKNGEVVGEQYFRGLKANRQRNIKSASKSVLALAVGIALERGDLKSLDEKLIDYYPDYFEGITDERTRSITLRNLLIMSSGQETTSFYNYGRWVASKNWVKAAIKMDQEYTPGSMMVYSTANSHLVSAMLTKATGMSAKSYANKYLFSRMGIRAPSWDTDPQGIYFGGNNMALTARDLLKLGEMVRNGGKYKGRQIVPADWIAEATKTQIVSSFSRSPYGYGYFWWNYRFGGHDTIFAWGHGGQFIFIVPDLELVMVCTSRLTNRPRGIDHNGRIHRLLSDYVIPAVNVGTSY